MGEFEDLVSSRNRDAFLKPSITFESHFFTFTETRRSPAEGAVPDETDVVPETEGSVTTSVYIIKILYHVMTSSMIVNWYLFIDYSY